MCGGSAGTTGFLIRHCHRWIGDRGRGHLCWYCDSIVCVKRGRGQRVSAAMQDSVLNLCRVKMRDQRLDAGPLKEYSQFGEAFLW